MSDWKKPLGINVLDAARQRIAWIFDNVPRIYVSFSGGKDSTVMTHLVMTEAKQRNRKVGVLFIDWEAQYHLTLEHVAEVFEMYKEWIDPYWIALPMRTVNACSMEEPEWVCWEEGKEWVREKPKQAITDPTFFPFYTEAQTFEEFVPAFGQWYSQGQLTACFVGIRVAESLNRWRTIVQQRKQTLDDKRWTTWHGGYVYNAYPLYDWKAEDLWTYHGTTGLPYNRLYDRMHQAGVPLHNMRICEPYGDEQRKGLWLFHVIEPETWSKIVARVAGANTGALYANEKGNILGNVKIELPEGYTWQKYAMFLLETMPPHTAEHYKNKIAVYLNYCMTHYDGKYKKGLPDTADGDTGGNDVPSWRRICKTLLKNDYWCKNLSFSPTKTAAYVKYQKVMEKRRQRWNIF